MPVKASVPTATHGLWPLSTGNCMCTRSGLTPSHFPPTCGFVRRGDLGRSRSLTGEEAAHPIVPIPNPAYAVDMSQERLVLNLSTHPNGGYLSYMSTQNNRRDIFVQTFPALDRRWPVSSGGGEEVRWNPKGGHELIYRWGMKWYSVDVKLNQPKTDFSVPRAVRHRSIAFKTRKWARGPRKSRTAFEAHGPGHSQ